MKPHATVCIHVSFSLYFLFNDPPSPLCVGGCETPNCLCNLAGVPILAEIPNMILGYLCCTLYNVHVHCTMYMYIVHTVYCMVLFSLCQSLRECYFLVVFLICF
jgi:hypothetical protein